MSMKNSSDTIGNRTRDLTACSAVPQPTAPQRTPITNNNNNNNNNNNMALIIQGAASRLSHPRLLVTLNGGTGDRCGTSWK